MSQWVDLMFHTRAFQEDSTPKVATIIFLLLFLFVLFIFLLCFVFFLLFLFCFVLFCFFCFFGGGGAGDVLFCFPFGVYFQHMSRNHLANVSVAFPSIVPKNHMELFLIL